MNLETIYEYLQEEGYRPHLDDDGDIKLKCGGKTYWITGYGDDDIYVRVFAAGQIWPMKTEEEWQLALQVTDGITRDYTGVKAYTVNKDDVFFSIDLLLCEPTIFPTVFKRCISALDAAVRDFISSIKALSGSGV